MTGSRGEPGEPGQPGQAGTGGGGQGGQGGHGGRGAEMPPAIHGAAFVRTWGMLLGWVLLLGVVIAISIQSNHRDDVIQRNEETIVRNQIRIIANLHALCLEHTEVSPNVQSCPYDRGIPIPSVLDEVP